MYMWQTKTFKTQAACERWIERNEHKYQIEIIFVNNAYGVQFRKLRRVY